jgi:hypothetical protein
MKKTQLQYASGLQRKKKDFLKNGIQKLVKQCQKCIEVGDQVEN